MEKSCFCWWLLVDLLICLPKQQQSFLLHSKSTQTRSIALKSVTFGKNISIKEIFTVAFYLEKLYKHPKIRDDGLIPLSYVGGATFGQIMGTDNVLH